MERVILHSDMNNFYASVECAQNSSLKGKPLAVLGDPEARHGIVLAKNYEAKKFNIQTGDTMWQAQKKCPEIVFVPPHYNLYMKYSKAAKEIYSEYTEKIEPYGLDENWLDVTQSRLIFGNGKEIADNLRKRIKSELGITASIGVSFNKIFAKLGSDLKKPDATTVINSTDFKEKIWSLPVSDLLYVGRSTCRKLKSKGINTIGELAGCSPEWLEKMFGKPGIKLWQSANGLDRSPVSDTGEKSIIKSVGNGMTTPRDIITDEDIKITLMILSESVSSRLREQGFVCQTVQIGVRDNEFYSYERQGKLDIPNRTAKSIFQKAYSLYKQNPSQKPIRSLTVRACSLIPMDFVQLSFFDDTAELDRQESMESAVDELKNRFGKFVIQKAIMLTDPKLSNISPKDDHITNPFGN